MSATSALERVLSRLGDVGGRNGSGHMALCPGHEDRNPSLSISEGNAGQVLLHCHAGCRKEDVLEALGLRWRDLYPAEAHNGHRRNGHEHRSWRIKDAAGELVAVHHRIDKPEGKQVWWRGPRGEQRLSDIGLKAADLPLYRSEHARGWSEDLRVVVVEGETAADALARVYPPTLATVTGAEKTPGPEALAPLRGRSVVLWCDNDEPGRGHMERVAAALVGIASKVRVFEWSGAPEKGDAADHPATKSRSKATLDGLLAEMDASAVWEQSLPSSSSRTYREDDDDDDGQPLVKSFRELPKADGPRRETVEGLIPERFITSLYGDGGSAKSVIALSIAQGCARGDESWLGFKLRPCPALFVDFELDDEEQGRRARQIARARGDEEPPTNFYYLCAAGCQTEAVLNAALAACTEHGIGLVVLDSVGMAMDGDPGSGRDVVTFFRKLERFRAAGVTVLLVDHQGKAVAGESYQAKTAYGSVYKGNLSRSRLQVEAQERSVGELSVVIRQNKANFSGLADPFRVKLSFGEEMISMRREELREEELRQERTLNASDRVLLALWSEDAAYPADLVEPTGVLPGTAKNALTDLKRRGLVEPTGERQGRSQEVRLTADGGEYVRRYLADRNSSSSSSFPYRGRDDDDDGGEGRDRHERLVEGPPSPAPTTPEEAAPAGGASDAVRAFLSDPPGWFRRQARLCAQQDSPERLLNPLASAVATHLFGGPQRWREILPAVEEKLRGMA